MRLLPGKAQRWLALAAAAGGLMTLWVLRPGLARASDYVQPPLTVFLNAGITINNKSSANFTLSNGTLLTGVSAQDPWGKSLDVELDYKLLPFVAIGPLFDGIQYLHQDGAGNDHLLSFMMLTRAQTGDSGFVFWVGVAAGLMLNNNGESTFSISGGNYAVSHSWSNTIISPRFGIDYILDGVTIGAQAAYFSYSDTLTGTESDQLTKVSVPISDALSRSFWQLSARFGFQL